MGLDEVVKAIAGKALDHPFSAGIATALLAEVVHATLAINHAYQMIAAKGLAQEPLPQIIAEMAGNPFDAAAMAFIPALVGTAVGTVAYRGKKKAEELAQLHELYIGLDGLRVPVHNQAFLNKAIESSMEAYLRYGHKFTIFAGDIAGMHYTNERPTEGWSYGTAKLFQTAIIFSNLVRRGECLAVPGRDEFFLVLRDDPDINTITKIIEDTCGAWSRESKGKSPLALGFGTFRANDIDAHVTGLIGKSRPETAEEWKTLARQPIADYICDQVMRLIRQDKEQRVYKQHPEFIR